MPAYTVGGKILLITAAFKAHMALNFWRGQELESSHVGRCDGPVRQDQIAGRTCRGRELDRLIREAAELAESAPAPRKTKHAPKPAPELHPDSPPLWPRRLRRKRCSIASRRRRSATISNGSPKPSRTRPAEAHRHRDRMARRRQAPALEVRNELLKLALSRFDIAPGRILDRLELALAGHARALRLHRLRRPAASAIRASRATSCPCAPPRLSTNASSVARSACH